MDNKIWLSSPHMGGKEEVYVQDAFATNWIAPLGPHVDGFENDLGVFLQVPHVAALSSGTAALHLALILAGVEQDDLVICQSFTFSASANPIVYQKAKPVFVDSERDTWNMDPVLLEETLTKLDKAGKRPKAVIVVHLYGMPAQMSEIIRICQKFDVTLIEDAAESLGSTYQGKACGAFGNMAILSFNGNKIITSSGGGALTSSDESLVRQARFLSTQARDAAPHYQHSHIGYNYRISNVCAAIGRGQMEVLNMRIEQRRRNYQTYVEALSELPGVQFLPEPEGAFSNRWLTCLTVDSKNSGGISRETIRLSLETENIESRPLWKPMHMQPVFSEFQMVNGAIAESLFETGLCLPSGSNLTQSDLDRVIHNVLKCFKK